MEMTLRDYFAAKAMQAMYGNNLHLKALGSHDVAEKVARISYEIADAMLAERNK